MKIAGLKGRSPEAYPTSRPSGLVTTSNNFNASSIPLGTSPTLINAIGVLAGRKAIVMFSGVITATGSTLVEVAFVLDGMTTPYLIDIEASASSSIPFSLVYETGELADSPSVHTIDIQAFASDASTATIAAGSSAVVISTPT